MIGDNLGTDIKVKSNEISVIRCCQLSDNEKILVRSGKIRDVSRDQSDYTFTTTPFLNLGGFNAGMLATVWVTSHLMQSGAVAPPEMAKYISLNREDDAPIESPEIIKKNSSCDAQQGEEDNSAPPPLSPSQSTTSQVSLPIMLHGY